MLTQGDEVEYSKDHAAGSNVMAPRQCCPILTSPHSRNSKVSTSTVYSQIFVSDMRLGSRETYASAEPWAPLSLLTRSTKNDVKSAQ